jgi:hypothetical protein
MKNLSVSRCPASSFGLQRSLSFFMIRMFAATATELPKLKPIGRSFLVLCRDVVAVFAVTALQYNIIAWHISHPDGNCRLPTDSKTTLQIAFRHACQTATGCGGQPPHYSMTSVIVPAPTVRPPSRIANRRPFSIAMGVINSMSIATLSPGITISTPAGKCATPVTSVVRK